MERVVEVMVAAEPGESSARRALIAALAGRGGPELASRVQRDLEREGVVIEELGLGMAGDETVVMVRVARTSRPALERVAQRSALSLSFPRDGAAGADRP